MSATPQPKRSRKESVTRIAARARAKTEVPTKHKPVAYGAYASTLSWFVIELVKGWGIIPVPAGAEAALTPVVGLALAWYVRHHEDDDFFPDDAAFT